MTHAAQQGFGGLLLFGTAAPTTLVSTLTMLPNESPDHEPLLVMGDEEGGGVDRLPSLIGSWPWAQVMGATFSPTQITAEGRRVGLAMHRAGLTMDLAPVADVDGRAVYPGSRDPDGLRSFGGNSTRDATDVVAFAHGLAQGGVIATLKHFPGLGGSSGNTDTAPATTLPWSTLKRTALAPFRAGIAAGVPAIMMSNAVVPGLTRGPASLSVAAVDAVRALGFRGALVTDALSAGAIEALHLTPAAAAVAAIASGEDLVLNGQPTSPTQGWRTAQSMVNALVQAVATKHLALATLRTAAEAVWRLSAPLACHP